MSTEKNFYSIVNGPSKFDLMVSLFDAKEVYFTIEGNDLVKPKKIKIKVIGILAEDGSRESWIINYFYENKSSLSGKPIFYRSNRRIGHITIDLWLYSHNENWRDI